MGPGAGVPPSWDWDTPLARTGVPPGKDIGPEAGVPSRKDVGPEAGVPPGKDLGPGTWGRT